MFSSHYIRNELSAHIEEAEEEYIKNGSNRETAMAKAVKGMGSPAEIGKSLDREHRMKPEISIMLLTLVFAVIGLAAMFASRGYGVFSFGKYVISAIIGILALVGTYFFDYTKIEKHSFKIYAVSLCILYIMAFAALLIAAAAVVFIIRIFMSAFKIKNRYGFALSICACTMLAAQFVIGILVNLGLIPVVSAGIPFISYGGTGYVTNMILTGIILSVWRRNSVAAEMTESTKKRSFIYFENKKLIIDFGSH